MRSITALLVGVCSSVLLAVVFGLWHGSLNFTLSWCALGGGTSASLWAWLKTPGFKACRPGLGPAGWLIAVVFALFSLRAFCWLVYCDGNSIKFLSTNNAGDLPLHLAYIRHMASGAPFWPDDPIFHGIKLHYPLGVDLFNSLLTLIGVDPFRGLVWAGLIGCLATGIALYRWGGTFTLAGFLFNGGIAGFTFLYSFQLEDYQDAVAWKSIPLAMFVTQRGLLYAIPAGLLLLTSWRERFFSDGAKQQWKLPIAIEILLYASMPLFHLHTFIFLSFMLGAWLAVLAVVRPPCGIPAKWKQVLTIILVSLVPATIMLLLVSGTGGARSAVHLQPGWMQGHENFFQFWFKNFGVLPLFVLALCSVLVVRIREQWREAAFVFPTLAIFLTACVVMFAPWEWDNTKLMIWCYLAILPFLWECLLAPRGRWIRGLCCFALFFSGFISLVGGIDASHGGYDLAERSEVDAVGEAVKPLPLSDTFAASSAYSHPLLLNGRKIAVGYPGHLWSHGIANYAVEENSLRSLMMGEPSWREIARHLNVRFIFWGTRETGDFPNSAQPWKTECRCVAHDPAFDIYDLLLPEKN